MKAEQPANKAVGTTIPSWILASVNWASSITADEAVLINKVWRYWEALVVVSFVLGLFFFLRDNASGIGSKMQLHMCAGGYQSSHQLVSIWLFKARRGNHLRGWEKAVHCHCCECSLGRWEWAGQEGGPAVNPCLLLAGLLLASPPAEAVMLRGIRGDTNDSPAPGNYGGEPRTAG